MFQCINSYIIYEYKYTYIEIMLPNPGQGSDSRHLLNCLQETNHNFLTLHVFEVLLVRHRSLRPGRLDIRRRGGGCRFLVVFFFGYIYIWVDVYYVQTCDFL